jgi:hypothetical protein
MPLRKPFRAVPLQTRRRQTASIPKSPAGTLLRYLGLASLIGGGLGVASVAADESGRAKLSQFVRPIAVSVGLRREREPQAGDLWQGCDDARAAGTAPIHLGEPGYRKDMDGDGDGIACEP